VTLSRTVLVAFAVLLLVVSGAAAGGAPNVADLEAELVCPTCKTTLDQSNAPIALRMKAIIRARVASGASSDEIKAELVDQFGPAVLAEPPKHGFDLLAWLLPLVGVALGAVGLGALAFTWSRRAPDPGAAPLDAVIDPELEKRIDRELERVDE
jgi:cytochrome c-type biogenesis protein CcmH